MSKFNTKTKTPQKPKVVTNLSGGKAYAQGKETELASLLLTSFLKDKAYETEAAQKERLNDLLDSFGDSKFPAQAAIFARNEFGMRSISHLIASEIGERVKGKEWTKNFFEKVVRRVDDITEILSATLADGRTIPNSMKKGLASSFSKFDEYQLAKYRGEGKEVSLVDAVNLLHPTPTDKNRKALKLLIEDKLRSKETWEAKISATGKEDNAEEAKSEAWADLITSGRIGYFALLRNLRNILESISDVAVIESACEILTNKKKCHDSLVLPFRFMTAYLEIEGMSLSSVTKKLVLSALNKAMEISCDNVPLFEGRTLVVADFSGSMGGAQVSGALSFKGLAALFATVLSKRNIASDIMIFGTDAAYVKNFNADDSIFTNLKNLMKNNEGHGSVRGLVHVGHGTNFMSIFERAKEKYDRIVIFSDMQANLGHGQDGLDILKKKYGGETPLIIAVDLAGNGSTQFKSGHVQISGWSEKIFDLMKNDPNSLVKRIKEIEL